MISVRIKKAVKTKLEEGGIDVQNEVRAFLDQKASQIELKEALDRMETIIRTKVKPSKQGFAVKSVREDRNAAH